MSGKSGGREKKGIFATLKVSLEGNNISRRLYQSPNEA